MTAVKPGSGSEAAAASIAYAEMDEEQRQTVALALRLLTPRSDAERPPQGGSHWLQVGERAAASLTQLGVGCIFLWQPGYPRWLREAHAPPVVLYYRGLLSVPAAASMVVVGTRNPIGVGRESRFRLGYELAACRVVPRLARSIDSATRRGGAKRER